jgi:AraC-like DNA-binding protein
VVTLLDTDQLPPAERRPAQVVARLEAALVSRVRLADPGAARHARLDAWDVGGLPVLRADLAGDPVLARSARGAREDVAPAVSFAVQEIGVGMQEQFGTRRTVPRGGLVLTEVAAPYEYRWVGSGVCRALQVPVSRLGLPVDDVRRALSLAHRSPLYGLVRAHLTEVTRDAERLSGEPQVHALAAATVDLARALLVSAAGPSGSVEDMAAETLLTRVRSYVRQHLTEPGLDAEQVAAAHAMSVRQLYRLCSAAQFSLEQWIIHQRLEGARAELAAPRSRDRSIAVIARRWGFTDPSYFSRRFRATFGLTPRDWRQAGGGTPVLPRPRTELDLSAGRPGPPAPH